MNKPHIGIMTFYAVQNYGAVLQAFALQQCLKSLNADVELVRFCDQHNEQRNVPFTFANRLRTIWETILNNPSFLFMSVMDKKQKQRIKEIKKGKKQLFSAFRDNYLQLSPTVYENMESLKASNKRYDAYICGSDMVWTPIGQNLEAYFLRFAPQNKRFSFSPSLTGCSSFSDQDKATIIRGLCEMRTLSCREQEGVDFVKNETGKDALLTLDPTILLTKEQWKDELALSTPSTIKPYILCYMFGGVPDKTRIEICNQANKRNMDVRYIPMSQAEILREQELSETPYYGPKEFVDLFLNASFIVTNTYHGFLFSLISENPFVVVRREKNNKWKANEGRISNLLDELGLSDRYVELDSDLNDDFFELDYTGLNILVNNLRVTSMKYLSSIVEMI